MAIQTLKEGLHAAKAEFATRLVSVLIERTDLSQKQIGNSLGVSESFVRKTAKRFSVPLSSRRMFARWSTITPAAPASWRVLRFRSRIASRIHRFAIATPSPAARNNTNAPGRINATSVKT